MNIIKTMWSQDKEYGHHILFLILTIATVGFYISMISTKDFSVAEGWYSVYAKSINSGLLPYRDFELLFPPFYLYFIALITNIFGYDIIVLRIIGIIIYISITVLIYFIFRKFFVPVISMIATISSALFLQSETLFITYDYIRIYDLLTYSCLLVLLSFCFSLDQDNCKKSFKQIFLCGIFAGLALLVRQNSGVIFAFYCILALLILSLLTSYKKTLLKSTAFYILGLLLPIALQLLQLVITDSFTEFFSLTTSGALTAKGGLLVALFAWIPTALKIMYTNQWVIYTLCLALILGYFLYRKTSQDNTSFQDSPYLGIIYFIALVSGLFVLFFYTRLSAKISTFAIFQFQYPLFAVVFVVFCVLIVVMVKRQKSLEKSYDKNLIAFMLLIGATIAQGYGSGTSGGLSAGQGCLQLGIVVALLLYFVINNKYRILPIILCAYCLLYCFSYAGVRNVTPYDWWGLTDKPQEEMKYETNIPVLSGIKVTEDEQKMYNEIYEILNANLSENDEMFVFPHIPIFYLFADKIPFTYTYVQWFDVSTTNSINNDIEKIEEESPKVIILCEIPEWVMEGHENGFDAGDESATRKMQVFLKDYVDEGNYDLAKSYVMPNDYNITVYVAKE